VVAQEDFSDPANHRFGTDGDTAARNEVTDGVYRVPLLKRDTPRGQLAMVEGGPSTVSIALDMSMTGSESGSYMGPLCYFQQKFGFSLKVHPDGAYELVQVNAQGEEVAILADGTGAPLKPGSSARLRLDCEWGLDTATATGWVGDQQVGPAGDVEPSDNALRSWAATGFWAMSTSQSSIMKVEVDNVVLTQL
jgi:hypothetical protein